MLGSPFMGRLMTLCADRLPSRGAVADRLLGWPGDVTAGGHSLPLRLAGALHALVLDGTDAALARVYPPNAADDEALWAEVARALTDHADRILRWLDSAPQTNEVGRSAVLIAAALFLRARHDLPLVVSELGASAGLNLAFDRYALVIGGRVFGARASPVRLAPDWTGPLPPDLPVEIRDRAGVDLAPPDLGDPVDRLRLLAYLWPDQPDRLARTRAAMALAGTRPDTGDAAAWLEARLAARHPGAMHLVCHTIAWQYFPPSTQTRCRRALAAAGRGASPDAPLAHLAMEADAGKGSAAMSLTIWDGSRGTPAAIALGRADFHGRFVEWDTGALFRAPGGVG